MELNACVRCFLRKDDINGLKTMTKTTDNTGTIT